MLSLSLSKKSDVRSQTFVNADLMDTTSLPPCLPPSVEDHTEACGGCVDTEACQSSVGAASVMSHSKSLALFIKENLF